MTSLSRVVVALVVPASLLAGCLGSGAASHPVSIGSPAVSPSPTESEQPASPEPAATGSESTGEAFPELAMIRAVNPGISLRAGAGLSAERIGSLAQGSRSVILEGPVEADGHAWYLLSGPGLPPASGCMTPLPSEPFSCPIWHGWAAAGPGHAWFTEDASDCPDPSSDVRGFAMMGDYEALHCYGGRELSMVGWLRPYPTTPDPEPCPTSGSPGAPDWLWCHERWWEALYDSDDEAIFVDLFVDPASGITIPHDGRWVAVTGHIDDPRAAGCTKSVAAGHPIPPEIAVRECRAAFVVTTIRDSPAP